MADLANTVKELEVYKLSYAQAMDIFRISKTFLPEERYALTSQIRRSSRSVPANLREAWAKRRYPAHFLSKLTDFDAENDETNTHIDFALDCNYIDGETHQILQNRNVVISKMLGKMISYPNNWTIKK